MRFLKPGTISGVAVIRASGSKSSVGMTLAVGASTSSMLPAPQSTCGTPTGACGVCLDGFATADCNGQQGPTRVYFRMRVTAGSLLTLAAIPGQFGSSAEPVGTCVGAGRPNAICSPRPPSPPRPRRMEQAARTLGTASRFARRRFALLRSEFRRDAPPAVVSSELRTHARSRPAPDSSCSPLDVPWSLAPRRLPFGDGRRRQTFVPLCASPPSRTSLGTAPACSSRLTRTARTTARRRRAGQPLQLAARGSLLACARPGR